MKFIQVECRLGCLGEINIKSCNSIVLSVSLCVFRRRWRAVLCCWCSAPLSDSFTCRTSAHRALCYVGLARWFLVLCPIMQRVLAEVGVFLCKIKLPQRGGESWCAVCVWRSWCAGSEISLRSHTKSVVWCAGEDGCLVGRGDRRTAVCSSV